MKDVVSCKTHGPSGAVIVCIHVYERNAAQLYVVSADAEVEGQAWCAECERARIADEGWYDKADAVAQWDVVCVSCYQALTEHIRDVTHYDAVETPEPS